MKVPSCRLCESKHWTHEPHAVKGVEVRQDVKELLAGNAGKVVTKVVSSTETGRCAECGGPLTAPKRGFKPTYCKPYCRVKASRKRKP